MKEVNTGLQDLLASPALLDRMASLVLREKGAPRVRKEKAEPPESRDPLEALGLPVLLVPKVSRANVAVPVAPVLLAFLVHVVFLVLLAVTGTQDLQGPAALQARTGRPVPQVTPDLLEVPECRDPKATPANRERRGRPAPRALRALRAHLDLRGSPERAGSPDPRACPARAEAPVLRASRVKMGNLDLVATMVSVVLLELRVFPVCLVLLVSPEEMETLDQMVSLAEMDLLVARVIVVKMVLPGPLEPLVIRAPQGLWVQLGRAVTEEKQALLGLLVLLVLLVPEVLLVPKAHVVTKVKLGNVVLTASKDTEDSLAIRAPQALQVLRVTRVPWVVQGLQAPEDLLDPVGLLAKMEQVDILVPSGHQGLEVPEVNEDLRVPPATQDSQALLDPRVPLVLAVVGLLPLLGLEVVKNLVAMPRIMEMIRWILKSTLKRLCLHSNLLMDK